MFPVEEAQTTGCCNQRSGRSVLDLFLWAREQPASKEDRGVRHGKISSRDEPKGSQPTVLKKGIYPLVRAKGFQPLESVKRENIWRNLAEQGKRDLLGTTMYANEHP
ncbi:hypothetical protein KSZ_04880 [Dictyobacter formicarum]|uniref:Uncharacterized protein n=1 Tax=Dictyobacter formicarum TaxID=2778368 RepID=A0ABQ3V8M5_9CHLR|nr:hypothetical protein KSZ_04880 [Dictyobacter formicarum]